MGSRELISQDLLSREPGWTLPLSQSDLKWSTRRLGLTPAPRRGEAAKNSARLPFRLVFRFHSFAATTMAAARPWRAILCGPSDCALSNTSLNFAFASATVQVCVLMVHLQSAMIYYGHNSHSWRFGTSEGANRRTQRCWSAPAPSPSARPSGTH